MPAFVSPFADLTKWTLGLAAAPVTLPAGLRYAGYTLPGLQATNTSTAGEIVQAPATGILRRVASGGLVFVELQVYPFPIRRVASQIPGGLPTFYLIFSNPIGLTFMDGDEALGGETLRSAAGLTIAAIGQDRQALSPALWAERIRAAIAAGGGVATQWTPFANAISAAITGKANSPVLLYDHAGQLRSGGTVDIIFTNQGVDSAYQVALESGDRGDLQAAVRRVNRLYPGVIPFANLWDGEELPSVCARSTPRLPNLSAWRMGRLPQARSRSPAGNPMWHTRICSIGSPISMPALPLR